MYTEYQKQWQKANREYLNQRGYMKKYLSILVSFLIGAPVYGAFVTHTDYQSGTTITASGQNANENAIIAQLNGNIDGTNICAGCVLTANIASGNISYTILSSGLQNTLSYRRPRVLYIDGNDVNIEPSIDGTSGEVNVIFPDGTSRKDSTAGDTTCNITQNAVLSGSKQGGLRTGSASANTWYSVYAVKATDNNNVIVCVLDTVTPIQVNFATLNSNFGTNGWVYLGVVPYGDNSTHTAAFAKFVQSGNRFVLANTLVGSAETSNIGILLAGGTNITAATYSYAAGTTVGTQIPNQISLVTFRGAQSGAGKVLYTDSAPTIVYAQLGGFTGKYEAQVNDTVATLGFTVNPASSQNIDISLVGWLDNILGPGSNPLQ